MSLILGIETSCDETGVAVVRDGCTVLSNVVISQIDTHRAFGGVVPEIASRMHTEVIYTLAQRALEEAGLSPGRDSSGSRRPLRAGHRRRSGLKPSAPAKGGLSATNTASASHHAVACN